MRREKLEVAAAGVEGLPRGKPGVLSLFNVKLEL